MLRHASWQAMLESEQPPLHRLFAMTTQGSGSVYDMRFLPGDWLVFGAETRGLAPELRESFPPSQRLKVPMRPGQRSLNLSNTVAVTVFEAWRQNGFGGVAADHLDAVSCLGGAATDCGGHAARADNAYRGHVGCLS